MMRATVVPLVALAAALDVAQQPGDFDWKQLVWAAASALVAVAVEALRRWLMPSPGVKHGDPGQDPPA